MDIDYNDRFDVEEKIAAYVKRKTEFVEVKIYDVIAGEYRFHGKTSKGNTYSVVHNKYTGLVVLSVEEVKIYL